MGGQAAFTSDCAHMFHLHCVLGSATCPSCAAPWNNRPATASRFSAVFPAPRPVYPPPPAWVGQPNPFSFQPSVAFNDDEPVEPPLEGWEVVPEAAAAHNGVLVLNTHCEHPAVARDAAHDNFAVLVHAKAPVAAAEAAARAPLDLVTVLDVSTSMQGSKIALLKQAMGFVIDKLGPGDRLSVVTFSCNARRIIRLTRMSEDGKALAKSAVESLRASGSTNIGDGLRVAAQVLDHRRTRNAVASIILLSDGQDNKTMSFGKNSYVDLVPHTLRRCPGNRCPPIHTFGFGTDHDAAALHAVAEVTGGTFSFVENEAVVQDSFANCIGGLLSTAVQEARVDVACLHPGVRVRAVKSGCYESRVDADGRAASVDVGELYAEEERRFLLFVDVPVAAGDGAEGGGDVTRLIKVSCTYKDAATGQSVDVTGEDAVVQRPVVVADTEPSVDVARERFRVEATEDIAAAREAAERGEYAEAARILNRRQEASPAAGLAGDARCAALVAELRELSARVANRREYEETGRACLLAGISSHAQQRASTVQLKKVASSSNKAATVHLKSSRKPMAGPGAFPPHMPGAPNPMPTYGAPQPVPGLPMADLMATYGAGPPQPPPSFGSAYATPAMRGMVESSRKRREQQQ